MKRIPAQMARPSRSRGFTLLEILIAMVILAIGLLGIAALQGVGLRSSHGAYLTSQASLLAYDIADRIRANPPPAAGYGFDTDTVNCTQSLPTTPLITADLAEWACAVQALLPNGRGTITATWDNITRIFTYTIDIVWEDLQVEEDAAAWSYQLVIDV